MQLLICLISTQFRLWIDSYKLLFHNNCFILLYMHIFEIKDKKTVVSIIFYDMCVCIVVCVYMYSGNIYIYI